MAKEAKISPLGLYNWDDTIFDLMVIPEELDRDILIENLLAETAEFEVLYPNPTVFKNLLGIWSHKQLDIWERMYATTQYEYNPIENYNRIEEGSESGSGTTTHGGMDTHADRVSGDGEDTLTIKTKDEHYVAGYDAPTPTEENDGLFKQTRDEGGSTNTTEYGKIENSEGNVAYGHTIGIEHEGEHESLIHGNIGVTTTQRMIQEEREIVKFNMYDIIIEEFTHRFCIIVY